MLPPLEEAIAYCVTRSADGKGSHIISCVNAYVTRMLPIYVCGMTHTACGQHISWCAAFCGPINVSSRCACPETKACSSSRGTAAHSLKVGTGLKRAVSFTSWPIYRLYWKRGNVCQSTTSTSHCPSGPDPCGSDTSSRCLCTYCFSSLSFSRHCNVGLYWCALAILSL